MQQLRAVLACVLIHLGPKGYGQRYRAHISLSDYLSKENRARHTEKGALGLGQLSSNYPELRAAKLLPPGTSFCRTSLIFCANNSVENGLLSRIAPAPIFACSRAAASVYPDMKMTANSGRFCRSFSTSSGPPMRGMTTSVTTISILPEYWSHTASASSPFPACNTL